MSRGRGRWECGELSEARDENQGLELEGMDQMRQREINDKRKNKGVKETARRAT